MIHTPQVVDRIIDLLKISGISDNSVLEEMTDHYLAEIEYQISNGTSSQTAIRNTYQQIALSDFVSINPKSKKSKHFFILFIALGLLLLGYYQLTPSCHNNPLIVMCDKNKTPPTGWPLPANITDIASKFGNRHHPVTKLLTLHKGVDINAKLGTPVLATGNAVVIDAGYNSSAGYYIILKHNESYSSKYNHLSKLTVAACQKINKGEQIGLVGSSGMSLGPHLHYEILKDQIPVDPIALVAP